MAGRKLLRALEHNFEGDEVLRATLLNKAPKYGNDVEWVDRLGAKWAEYFKKRLSHYTNYRGGRYHTGMYTVSAMCPWGRTWEPGRTGDWPGRPLADGGMSPVYGRDISGPTAVLNSVARLDRNLTSNGGLLNMKFLPEFFQDGDGNRQVRRILQNLRGPGNPPHSVQRGAPGGPDRRQGES